MLKAMSYPVQAIIVFDKLHRNYQDQVQQILGKLLRFQEPQKLTAPIKKRK